MEAKQIEDLWYSSKGTIYRLSHDFWNSYPKIEWDEYYGSALDCFIRCVEKYNEEKGNGACFNTYLYMSVKQYFKGMVAKHVQLSHIMITQGINSNEMPENQSDYDGIIRYPDEHFDRVRLADEPTPERHNIFKDMLSKMSADAKEAVNQVLSGKAKTKGEIRRNLLNRWHGEDIQNRISDAFREISNTLACI